MVPAPNRSASWGDLLRLRKERELSDGSLPEAAGPRQRNSGLSAPAVSHLLVAISVVFNLVGLRSLLEPVLYADDSAVHVSTTEFVTRAFQSLRFPLLSWYPDLNLGSPRLLHYQPGAALVTGLTGMLTGPGTSYRLWLYCLVSLWPVAIYTSSRLLRLPRLTAGIAALLSPLITSNLGIGFENHAYTWIGYGLFTPAFGMWMLPLSWAMTYRALDDRRFAPGCIALGVGTIFFHFETGYLAIMAMVALPFIRWSNIRERLALGALLVFGTLLGSMFLIGPVLWDSRYVAIDSALRLTGKARGYGARKDLWWLVSGQSFDHGRVELLTAAVVLGVLGSVVCWKSMPAARAALMLGGASLVLSFGPTTFGVLTSLVPGHEDIYFRRFLIGEHLAGLWIAAIGISWAGGRLAVVLAHHEPTYSIRFAAQTISLLIAFVVAVPCALQVLRLDQQNQHAIDLQRTADSTTGADLQRLAGVILRQGGGRTFAGTVGANTLSPRVGQVPAVMALSQMGVDVVGMPPLSSSTMSQPEQLLTTPTLDLDTLMGVRFLVTRLHSPPPEGAELIATSGPFELLKIPSSGYLSLQHPSGAVSVDRGDLLAVARTIIDKGFLGRHCLPSASWRSVEQSQVASNCRAKSMGVVLSQPRSISPAGPDAGKVLMRSSGVVVLSASFDQDWRATVDGRPAPVLAMAPALLGVEVGPGIHEVRFVQDGFPQSLWLLFAFVSIGGAMAAAWIAVRWGRRT